MGMTDQQERANYVAHLQHLLKVLGEDIREKEQRELESGSSMQADGPPRRKLKSRKSLYYSRSALLMAIYAIKQEGLMKQFLYRNGLWPKFMKWMESQEG